MGKECEVHTAVCDVAQEAGVLLEIIVLAVLKDEYAAFLEHIAAHYELGNFGQSLERVWRVGENEVVTLGASAYEAECVVAYDAPSLVLERC